MLNSFPGNIAEYTKSIKTHGKAVGLVLNKMSKTVTEIQQLFSGLNERMIDLKEQVNQLTFNERSLETAIGPSNCDYSPFYSKFMETLSVWRRVKRTIHRQSEAIFHLKLRQ